MTSKYNSVSVLDPFWLRKWKAGSFTSVGLGSGACLSQKNAVHGWSILTVGRVAILPIASPNLAKNVFYQVTVYKHGLNSATRVQLKWNEANLFKANNHGLQIKAYQKKLICSFLMHLGQPFHWLLPPNLQSTSKLSCFRWIFHLQCLHMAVDLWNFLLKCWSFAGVPQSSPGVLTLFCASWDHSDVPIKEDIKLKYSHHSMELHFINEN